jgi:hypothetical protein
MLSATLLMAAMPPAGLAVARCDGVPMTANSPSSVAEATSKTIHPDAQERRASDDELSAGFQSDLVVDEDGVDGLLAADEFAAEFDQNPGDAKLYAEYRRLAAEQAALRRVAVLVARGVGTLEAFGAVAEEMRRCVPAVTAGLWRFEADELIADAVVAGYPDEQNGQLLAEASRCSTLIDRLLEGRAFDEWRLCDVAGYLGLPINGPFVVVAARVPSGCHEPLPEIESKLHSLDISSVWRLLPDLQVGIVHVTSDQQLDIVVALITRMTTARVGVSAAFEDLRDTPRALHVARVMLRGPTDSTSSVAVFDGSILATAAVSAPEAMIKTVGAVLRCFGDLPDWDREMLLDTFRAWQNNDASVRGAGEVLMCHPNTVRYRLRRIEKRTGRSLSRPRDVAELCLAFEVHRRLM